MPSTRQPLVPCVTGTLVAAAMWLPDAVLAKPRLGQAKFSLYYVAEVESKGAGGVPKKVRDENGGWNVYRLSPADARVANMQGTVSILDDDGDRHLAAIVRIGEWVKVPKGWEGKGSRMNPLVPYRAVAADPRHHPYGSRVFIPPAAGYVTPRGKTIDGWMWVADVGGGIKGAMRFDIFVGREACYWDHIAEDHGSWSSRIQIEHPPKLPAALNPRNPAGVQKILAALGYRIDTSLPAVTELPDDWDQDVALGTALRDFQRQHPAIPEVEYGTRIGAITQWFLHQAGLAVSGDRPYAARPGGSELPADPPPKIDED